MSKISYVSGHLHRISDQLAAAEKKEYQDTSVSGTEPERIIPEPERSACLHFRHRPDVRQDGQKETITVRRREPWKRSLIFF